MKILFLANDVVTYGSERSMLNLIDELKKKHIEVKVLLPKHGPLELELQKRKIEYKICRYFSWIKRKGEKFNVKVRIKVMCNNFLVKPIIKWIQKEKFDIIHSVNSAVCIGAYITKKIKILHVWHIREMMEEDHNLEFFNKEYAIKMLNSADKLIYISKSVENKYKEILNNRNEELIYNGIPVDKYLDTKMPSLKDNKFKLLIAGNICKTKGQEDAIKAIEYLNEKGINNLELQIAGDGNMQSQLEEYVIDKNLQENIKFLGFRNDLDDIRKNINIYLMCSKNEAFGRVTIESMMSKNLVIGSNTGGTAELIKDGKTGYLYKQGDYIDLANKIEIAIKDWNKSEEIIEKAYKEAIEDYSIKKCADKVYKVYEKLLKEKKNV